MTGGSWLSRGGDVVGCGCVEAGLGAVNPPLGPSLPPPLSCSRLLALAWHPGLRVAGGAAVLGAGRRDSADDGKLLQAVTRIIQNPCPAAIVHALVVEVQEAGRD